MNFINELKLLFSTITDWLILFVVFAFFFFGFNVGEVALFGHSFPFVLPSANSFAIEIFKMMVDDLSPAAVPLIVTGPMTAFIAQAKIALLLALIFTFPLLCHRLIRFIAPALYARERALLYAVTIPAALLFIGGLAFAYKFIIPATFSILYGYAGQIGVSPFLSIDEFLGLSIALMVVTGITATIPAVMMLLTLLGAIRASFWVRQWRFALIGLLVASAIITPDGSGVSMALLSVPGMVLYGLGIVVSANVERMQHKKNVMAVGNFSNQ